MLGYKGLVTLVPVSECEIQEKLLCTLAENCCSICPEPNNSVLCLVKTCKAPLWFSEDDQRTIAHLQ